MQATLKQKAPVVKHRVRRLVTKPSDAKGVSDHGDPVMAARGRETPCAGNRYITLRRLPVSDRLTLKGSLIPSHNRTGDHAADLAEDERASQRKQTQRGDRKDRALPDPRGQDDRRNCR